MKGAGTLVEENVTTVKTLVQDYLTRSQHEHLSALAAGDSAMVEAEGETFAAWRAPTASCSLCLRCARTWAARCAGTAWKQAGIAPATAAGSGRMAASSRARR